MDKKNAVKKFLTAFFGDDSVHDVIDRISRVKTLDKGGILFMEGQTGRYIYFLLEGKIKLYKTNNEGKEAIVHFVAQNEMFAEIILQLECCYPVTSEAMENCVLLEMDAAELFRQIEKTPKVAMAIIGLLARRIKYFVNMIENLTLKDVRGRFLHYLETLQHKGKNTVTLPVPKGELALLLGTTPETFSRLLKKLAEEEVIAYEGRKITFLKELDG
ncbi:Crp/Fnr family transcriptional regulator [Geovibrio thiophilus]|uniref:Crp/Fnr family transcriptional regulator n=1 Tax=Geovibrio thiophilus TaxID=139438 RepID=A0A410JXU8_9BACT|nr:Crp/Fnr family transcriptional regulator [Geovibrio thiophilus]QAR32994.1 Crp/Fnr family transcriptional regulator [Geovibrio thiophilus]